MATKSQIIISKEDHERLESLFAAYFGDWVQWQVPSGLIDSEKRIRFMDYILLITYLSVAIVFSFFCSIAEAVLLSITSQLHRRT